MKKQLRSLGTVPVSRLVRFSSLIRAQRVGILRAGRSVARWCQKPLGVHHVSWGVLSPSHGNQTSYREPESSLVASDCQVSMRRLDPLPLGSGTTRSLPSSADVICLVPPTRNTFQQNKPKSSLVALRRCLVAHPEMLTNLRTIASGYKSEGYLNLPADIPVVLNLHS